jgi:hypothetical protein
VGYLLMSRAHASHMRHLTDLLDERPRLPCARVPAFHVPWFRFSLFPTTRLPFEPFCRQLTSGRNLSSSNSSPRSTQFQLHSRAGTPAV